MFLNSELQHVSLAERNCTLFAEKVKNKLEISMLIRKPESKKYYI